MIVKPTMRRQFALRVVAVVTTLTACRGALSTTASAPNTAANAGAAALLLDPSNAEWTRPAPAVARLHFETTKGVFVLELVRAWGSIGVDRLYNLARLGYYNDSRFHRVRKIGRAHV